MRNPFAAGGRKGLVRKVLLAAFLISLFSLFLNSGEKEALVTDIVDGDTIVTLTNQGKKETIRYLLIDTPELHHPRRREEELAKEAKIFNASLVLNKKIRIELDKEERDKYGRLLAYVWVNTENGEKMVNETLIEKGLALPFFIPPNGKYLGGIMEATKRARSQNLGLWKLARKRIFTPSQIYAELPYLAGSYVTIDIRIDEVKKSGSRWLLSQSGSRCYLVIYDNNKHLLKVKDSLTGKRIKVVGKITASFLGAEIVISDPAQVIEIAKTAMPFGCILKNGATELYMAA